MSEIVDKLQKNKVPIMHVDSVEEIPEQLNNMFEHWDRTGGILLSESIEKHKVIISVMVPDFVEPYSSLGGEVPIILQCPEDSYIWKNLRFNIGMMEVCEDKGFKLITFDKTFDRLITLDEIREQLHIRVMKRLYHGEE